MNDITALMATMKAAAEKATEAHERLSAMPSDGLFDASLAENAQLESDITALIAHNDALTPANVLALVEALEKAQTERDELQQGFIANQEEAREAIKYAYELKEQLARACAGREEAVREVEETQKTLDHIHRRRVIWRGKAVTAEAEVATLRQRISELESRTVAVKLPLPRRKTADDYVDDTFEPCDLAAIYNACRLECEVKFKKALTAAGIQVIEGDA